jgi:putative spermidine/putrescine transport system permease protein
MERQPILRSLLTGWTGLFLVFLYSPMVVLAILSFQSGPEGGPQFPIEHWSIYWYRQLFNLVPASSVAPLPLGSALVRSLTLALTTMVVSTVLGTITAQAFRRHFRGSGVVFYLVVLGMMVPGVLVGLGMALTANYIGMDRNWWSTVFLVHVVYTYPFAFLVMLAIFNRFDRSVEEAAWSLGVSPITTFRRITMTSFPARSSPRAATLRCRLRSTAHSRSRSIRTSSPSVCLRRCSPSRCWLSTQP